MKKKYPKVSIIIPTYNRSHILINTIESVVKQSYKNIEIIIVDDGSSDNTHKIIAEYLITLKLNNVKYYFQKNQGAPVARNHGISKAAGEYLIFFDSDDFMHTNRIEKQIAAIINYDCEICACGFQYSDNNKVYLPPQNVDNALELFLANKLYGSTQSWMFSKDIIIKVGGYDEELSCFQDLDLVFRILCTYPKISIIREVLTTFNNHNEGERISALADSKKGLNSVYKSHLKRVNYFKKNFEIKLVRLEIKEFLSLVNRNIQIKNYDSVFLILKKSFELVPNKKNFKLKVFILVIFWNETVKGFINLFFFK